MARKNDDDINIFLDDICDEPTMNPPDLTRGKGDKILTHADSEFMSGISKEAEKALKESQAAILSAPLPVIPQKIKKNDAKNVMSVSIQSGGSLSKTLEDPLDNDRLVNAIQDNRSSVSILKAIMSEIAEEAAYIKAWRVENWGSGEDVSEITFRRIKMLKQLVETLVEQEKIKKEVVSGKVDFHGEAFQRVLKYFLETLQETFRKINIPVQYEDIFFTELAKAYDGFEKKAERIYYGKD